MADELELLRGANPVPADDARWGDRPLDADAERLLDRLPYGAGTGRRTLPGRWWPAGPLPARRPGRRLVWAMATAGVAAVTVLALTLAGPGAAPAVAAPAPLTLAAGAPAVPLDRLADLAAVAAKNGAPPLVQGSHVQTWSLGMTSGPDGLPPITLPEERVVRWKPDATHTELVVATDPRHPGKPVVADGDDGPRTVEDGHVLSRRTFPPMWSDAPPMAPPPHDPAALLAYLDEVDRGASKDTGTLLDAVSTLLDNWTLGARESATLVRVLAGTPGLRPAGQVTDRLGRPGLAYVYDDANGGREMLILAPGSGTVLGLETTVTRADPDVRVKAGDVMSYSAWMR